MSSDSRNKAIGYLRILQAKNHLLYIHFLADVLNNVSKFSQLLQKREVNLSEANDCLHATEDVLLQYKTRCVQLNVDKDCFLIQENFYMMDFLMIECCDISVLGLAQYTWELRHQCRLVNYMLL